MKTPESYTKDAYKNRMKASGAYFFMPVQTGYGQHVIDFLCCVPVIVTPAMVGARVGLFVGTEAKKEGVEEPTPKQASVLREIRAAGGVTYLATMRDEELCILSVV